MDALPVWLIITLLLNDLPFGPSRLVHTWPCLACPSGGGDGPWAFPPSGCTDTVSCQNPPALQSGLPGTPYMGLRGLACRSWSHPELSEMAPGVGQVLWDPGDPAGWSSGSCTLKSQPGRSAVSEESSRGRLGKEGEVHFRAAYAKMPMENVVDTLKCYPKQWIRHVIV